VPQRDVATEPGSCSLRTLAGTGGSSSSASGGAAGMAADDGGSAGIPDHVGGSAGLAQGAGASAGADDSGGAAGADPLDADGCPREVKNCDRTSSDCETDVSTVTTCGACNVSCQAIHGSVTCQNFRCVVPPGSCQTNYADCDNDGTNGCETSLLTDSGHCGSCGRSCDGGAPCTNGMCATVAVTPGLDAGGAYINDIYFSKDKVFWVTDDNTGLHFIDRAPPSLPADSLAKRTQRRARARLWGRSAARSGRRPRAPTGATDAQRLTVRGQGRRERDSNPWP